MDSSFYNHYDVLGIPRNINDNDAIRNAYRTQALKFHPDKYNDGKDEIVTKFDRISLAFQVLSDVQAKSVYDQFGEQGLKGGLPERDGNIYPGWSPKIDANGLFLAFFGVSSPFQVFSEDVITKIVSDLGPTGGLKKQPEKKQGPPKVIDLYCSLKELYNGSVKKVTITKKLLNSDHTTTREVKKLLTITIKPGFTEGTTISFPKEGDEALGTTPSDVNFVVKLLKNPKISDDEADDEVEEEEEEIDENNVEVNSKFSLTNKYDLKYKAKISLITALTGGQVQIRTLDDRRLNIPINQIISPGTIQTIPNEGLPKPSVVSIKSTAASADAAKSLKRGNLIIEFCVIFPKRLSSTQHNQLLNIFGVLPQPHPVHNKQPVIQQNHDEEEQYE